MIGIIVSELIRLRGRSVLIGWFGLTALFAVLINVVMFQVVNQGGAPPQDGPSVTFPTAARLLSDHGIVSGLAAASSFFGVITLAFWALASASDYSTGLIKIIVAAEPRRWALLLGKWIALAVFTAAATAVAVVVNLICAPAAASAGGYQPDAWGHDLVPNLFGAGSNLFLSLLVWGTLGLTLATLTRSAGIAIGVGVGYVLLLESIIKAAAASVGSWLPGITISALASGGSTNLTYGGALALGLAYVLVVVGISVGVFQRRDITD